MAAGGLLAGAGWYTLCMVPIAVGWLVALWRGWSRADALGLAGSVVAAALGALVGVGIGWMVGGLAAALAAWDLSAYTRWLEAVESPADARRFLLRHAAGLVALLAVGLLLAGLALGVRLRLSLPVMLMLGLVLILGISQALRLLRAQQD
jgi:hypothetical protein